jgi:hypothetical protein
VGILAVHDQHLPDLLHRMRRELVADLCQPRIARFAIVGGRLHLDQLVGREGAVHFGEDVLGEAFLVADHDDGPQLVRFTAQLAAARGSEGSGHGRIIGER